MSQSNDVLVHLQRYGSITPKEAADLYGCWRLAARVMELRQSGHPITTKDEAHHNGVHARYEMAQPDLFGVCR
jgi:hypothetical protein